MTDTDPAAVERFSTYAVDGGCDAYGMMEPDDYGDYVTFEAYTAIEAKISSMESKLEHVRAERNFAQLHLVVAEAKLALAIDALERLALLGNGDGNMIARIALKQIQPKDTKP